MLKVQLILMTTAPASCAGHCTKAPCKPCANCLKL